MTSGSTTWRSLLESLDTAGATLSPLRLHAQSQVHSGLLLREEAEALSSLPERSAVVWSWMTLFWSRALAGELDVTPVPHADQMMPAIMQLSLDGQVRWAVAGEKAKRDSARGRVAQQGEYSTLSAEQRAREQAAIGTCLSIARGQQSYPYVHLLSIITSAALVVNALTVGVVLGRQAGLAEEPGPRVAGVLFACGWLRVLCFTVLHAGLLAIGATLENPLGNDSADLPGLSHNAFMKAEAEAWSAGVDRAKAGLWWRGLLAQRHKL